MLRISDKKNRFVAVSCVILLGVFLILVIVGSSSVSGEREQLSYQPRQEIETSGFLAVFHNIEPWRPDASFEEYAAAYQQAIPRGLASVERDLETGIRPLEMLMMIKASLFHAQGDPRRAYEVLEEFRSRIKGKTTLEEAHLFTIIYYKGVTALRMGENDNCIMCRGESSCILPIAPAAVHTNPSRLPPGDRALHRVPRAVPRRPRGPLAAQPGPHDPGRVSRQGRSAVT